RSSKRAAICSWVRRRRSALPMSVSSRTTRAIIRSRPISRGGSKTSGRMLLGCCFSRLQQSPPLGAPLIPASPFGALLSLAVPFVGPSSEVSLARIWGLGPRRVGKFTVVASIVRPLQSRADDGADRHGQTSVLVGSWSGAKRRWIERSQAQSALGCFARRRYSLIAVLIGVGAFLLLVSQK